MFSPQPHNTRSTASPFRASSQGMRSAQTRRVASVLTPQRRGSPFVGKRDGNRSTTQTSQLLEESQKFRMEKFGTPMPVLITEALTYADRNSNITVKTEPSGWAWLVGGRKLFVWRYKQGSAARNVLCKELTLPPSDLAHSAVRVCVMPGHGDSQSASCIAVSPEGIVRYWPNIAYETSSAEISAELKGEECDCVINLSPYGCLLATTTSSLILLSPVPGQNTITCRSLTAAQGMFAGFGRRMSSLIFGAAQGQATGAPLQAVIAGNLEDDERPFYVLSGTHLQKWMVQSQGTEKFFYQIDADRLFREQLAKKVWDQDSIHMAQLTTWILDIQLTRDGVMILGAGLNLDAQPVVRYALAIIATDISGTPSTLESFHVLEHAKPYKEESETEVLGYRLLYPEAKGEEVFLYNNQVIVMAAINGGPAEEIRAPGGKILGAGVSDGSAVFFSITQGLVRIMSSQAQDLQASILDESVVQDITKADMSSLASSTTQIQELSMSDEQSPRFKAAFLLACSGSMKQAQEIIDQLLPDTMTAGGSGSSDLDRLVTHLSRDLIDDIPASDPRWAESVRQDSARSSSSLIILQQLKDKQKAHEYIINFLKKLNLWEKLKTVMNGENLMSTRLLLCEHAEKLEAAIVLREMHTEYSQVIDPAIRKVLGFRGDHSTPGLAPQDIFYREVSRIQEVIVALLEVQSEFMAGDFPPSEFVNLISSVNAILEGMLHGALQYRKSKAHLYQADTELEQEPEYIPWTSTSGSQGIRTLLFKQCQVTLEVAVPESCDIEVKGQLFQQLLSLVDNILDGYSSQISSLASNPEQVDRLTVLEERYLQERQNLITPFLEHKQYERAGSLSEKYADFETLIRICEETRNQERIQRYQEQFADRGFADFLFAWYMKEGKRGKLLSLPGPQQANLQNFLQREEFGYLKWLHDVECGDFKSAHETLLYLGRNEVDSLAKKKTLLSLSKLAGLAMEEEEEEVEGNIQGINEEQELILHQELLPADLVVSMNLDPLHMRVLAPVELIQLYICDENSSATEYDIKKALDLLQFIDQDSTVDLDSLRAGIWCKALLRDRAVWLHNPSGDPLDSVKDTIFFKTISLAAAEGYEPQTFLPHLQTLLASEEIADISHDEQLRYLLGAVYETCNQN